MNIIFDDLWMISMIIITVLLRKSSGLQRKHLLPPLPHSAVKGWGSNGSFQPEAVSLLTALKQREIGLRVAKI
jgi:hypothetical protein